MKFQKNRKSSRPNVYASTINPCPQCLEISQVGFSLDRCSSKHKYTYKYNHKYYVHMDQKQISNIPIFLPVLVCIQFEYIWGWDCDKRHNGSLSCSDVRIFFNGTTTIWREWKWQEWQNWVFGRQAVGHSFRQLQLHIFAQPCQHWANISCRTANTKNTNTNTNIQIQLHPFNIGQTFCARHKIVQNYGYHSHPSMIG